MRLNFKSLKANLDFIQVLGTDTCSGEFESKTPYMYSSWNCIQQNQRFEDETNVTNKKSNYFGRWTQ